MHTHSCLRRLDPRGLFNAWAAKVCSCPLIAGFLTLIYKHVTNRSARSVQTMPTSLWPTYSNADSSKSENTRKIAGAKSSCLAMHSAALHMSFLSSVSQRLTEKPNACHFQAAHCGWDLSSLSVRCSSQGHFSRVSLVTALYHAQRCNTAQSHYSRCPRANAK